MKAGKIAGALVTALLALIVLALLAALFQRLLIAGTQMARDVGDTVILTEEDVVGEGETEPFATDAPAATWPPGDDPSWSEDMPLSPVDKTAEELAEEIGK